MKGALPSFFWQVSATCLFFLVAQSAFGESPLTHATFSLLGTRYSTFFDAGSTGAVKLIISPAASATSEPLIVHHLALSDDDEETSAFTYDPQSTFSLSLSVSTWLPGAHYVIARMPLTHRIRWMHCEILPATNYSPPTASISRSELLARYHKLVMRKMSAFFDEDTTGTWLANDPDSDYHWMREDAYYAIALLDDAATSSHARANAILKTLAQAQDRILSSPTYGWFYTNAADLRTPQNASTFFIPPILASLCLNPPPSLQPDSLQEIREALWHVTNGVMSRFSFSPVYENFYFMGTATLALCGEIFDNQEWRELARAKLESAHSFFLPRGSGSEWNSPVYTAVSDWALFLIATHSRDEAMRSLASQLRERMWLDVALTLNPVHRQQAGPFSRVYEDGVRGGAGLTAFALANGLNLEGFDSPMRLAEMVAARHSLDINPSYWIAKVGGSFSLPLHYAMTDTTYTTPRSVRQQNIYGDTCSYIAKDYSLGSCSSTTPSLLGMEGFLLQIYDSRMPVGVAAHFSRAGITNNDAFGYEIGSTEDMFGFQHENRLLWLVDRTFPASTGLASQVFFGVIGDERFSQWEDWRVDNSPVEPHASIPLGSLVTARRGSAYLGFIPLYASSLGPRSRYAAIVRSSGHIALTLFGVDSATPQDIGNQRFEAAFAIVCGSASEGLSYEQFVAECLAHSTIEIVETATERSFAWEWGQTMNAAFSRSTRQWLSRLADGKEVSQDILLADFAVQSPTGTLSLHDFSAWNLPSYAWAVCPRSSPAALLVNPSSTPAEVFTSWTSGSLTLPPFALETIQRPPTSSINDWRPY